MIYSTTNMEQAAILMHERYRRVIVHCDYHIERRIRFQQNKVVSCGPRIARHSDPENMVTKAWEKAGGMLINMRTQETPPMTEAMLICEMPIEKRLLKFLTDRAEKDSVVYKCPTWSPYFEFLDFVYPSSESCQRFFDLLHKKIDNHEYTSIAKAIGLTGPIAAISDVVASDSLDIPLMSMGHMRDLVFKGLKRQVTMVQPLVPRIEPVDKTLMPAFEFVRDKCPNLAGHRLLVGNALGQTARFWKTTLKLLIRDGAVEAKPRVGFYNLADVRPEFNRIMRMRQHGEIELREVIDHVEKLPEYPK